MSVVFDKINQIAVLANETRFKILLALFNSDAFRINGKKLGSHSHSLTELKEIINIPSNDLIYHLNLMSESTLVEKNKNQKGFYHITVDGKKILRKFGVTSKLVKEEGRKLVN